jgi:hypothetical protein
LDCYETKRLRSDPGLYIVIISSKYLHRRRRYHPDGQLHEVGRPAQILQLISKGAVTVLKDKLSGDGKESLLFRLKAAMTKLRFIKRHAKVYSHAADKTISTVQDTIGLPRVPLVIEEPG